MTHAETRRAARAEKCAAGDARALLLSATAPALRSETAARYDHAIEAAELDRVAEPTQEPLDRLGIELWRASVAVLLVDTAHHQIVERYLGGHRTSAGMDRAIVRAEAATPFPSATEILAAWHDGRRLRREYIRQRYGV